MQKNSIAKNKTRAEIRKYISSSNTGFDAWYILQKAEKEMKKFKGPTEITSNTNYYKAMTLFEFDKGVLMMNALPELHRVFALDFCKKLQNEFSCSTPSEKSLAETVSLNFVRVLGAQKKLNDYLERGIATDVGVKYLKVMSLELDRAERHYLASLQALRSIKNPTFEVNIKANNALVAQNQAIQLKNP